MDDLNLYDYELPPELIAAEPLARRDQSRLLVIDRRTGELDHRRTRDLPALLRPGDCLVLNDTQVIPARLLGRRKATGGKWEGLYLGGTPSGAWRLIGQSRGRLNPGEQIVLVPAHRPESGEEFVLTLIERDPDGVWTARPEACAAHASHNTLEILKRFGTVPLPPYIRRKLATEADWERYQTTYSRKPGAVAAPTAGLHFTPELLAACRERGLGIGYVTLHVGIGTFRPIGVPRLSEHRMHSEWCELPEETADLLNRTRASGGRIVAVGTTTVRTLESAARAAEPPIEDRGWRMEERGLRIEDSGAPLSILHPLSSILHSPSSPVLQPWRGETDLFIRPPYAFRAVDCLLTNFHLPKSSLLVLVAALTGLELTKRAYQSAIRERYRFYSYGDAMLIL